jgi:predicted nucleotidyltransferase
MSTVQSYIANYKAQAEQAIQSRISAKDQATKILEEISKRLVQEDDSITRLIVFGSYLTDHFNSHSDLDIAIESSPEKFFRLWALANQISVYKVDLVDFRLATGYFREQLLTKGRVLYEK